MGASLLKSLQRLRFPQRQQKQCIHKFPAAQIICILPIGSFSFPTSTQTFEDNLLQVSRIVVLACSKRLQPSRQPIQVRGVSPIVVIWEYDMKVSIDLRRSQIAEMFRDEGQR